MSKQKKTHHCCELGCGKPGCGKGERDEQDKEGGGDHKREDGGDKQKYIDFNKLSEMLCGPCQAYPPLSM